MPSLNHLLTIFPPPNTTALSGDQTRLIDAASRGNIKEITALIELGTVDVSKGDYDFRTPLHLAASEGHSEVVKFLVSKGANINAIDRFGNSIHNTISCYSTPLRHFRSFNP
jgi:glutaminase